MFIPLHDSTPSTPLKSQLRVTTAAQVRGTNNLISHQCNQWSMVWPRPCRRLRLRLFRTHQSFVELSYRSPVVLQVQPGPNLPPHLRKTPEKNYVLRQGTEEQLHPHFRASFQRQRQTSAEFFEPPSPAGALPPKGPRLRRAGIPGGAGEEQLFSSLEALEA